MKFTIIESCSKWSSVHHNDPKSVTRLTINASFIDLKGIKMFPYLEKLVIIGRIFSLKGIDKCKRLRCIKISLSPVRDIRPLQKCKELRKIEIIKCNLNSLDGLEKCKELRHLDVYYNNVHSIECLKDLKHLRYLNVSANNIKHLHNLPSKLKDFNCGDNDIEELNLQDLTKLLYADCSCNDNLSVLNIKGCKSFQSLQCFGTSLINLDITESPNFCSINYRGENRFELIKRTDQKVHLNGENTIVEIFM